MMTFKTVFLCLKVLTCIVVQKTFLIKGNIDISLSFARSVFLLFGN